MYSVEYQATSTQSSTKHINLLRKSSYILSVLYGKTLLRYSLLYNCTTVEIFIWWWDDANACSRKIKSRASTINQLSRVENTAIVALLRKNNFKISPKNRIFKIT